MTNPERPDNHWLCTCRKCEAARRQLNRCQLKAEREARSRRVTAKLEAMPREEYADELVERAVGKQLRYYQDAGLGPALPWNIVADLKLKPWDIDRVQAILKKFARKGWVVEVAYPERVSNPTVAYKLVR